jgi:hypothetical protein
MDVFEGSNDAWRMLKVGDVLRVEAEKDDYQKEGKDEEAPWKATEAILVSKAKTDTSPAAESHRDLMLKMKEAEVRDTMHARLCLGGMWLRSFCVHALAWLCVSVHVCNHISCETCMQL